MNWLIIKLLDWFDRYNKGYHDGFEAGLQTRYIIVAAHEKRETQEQARSTDPLTQATPGTIARHHHTMNEQKKHATGSPTMHELPRLRSTYMEKF